MLALKPIDADVLACAGSEIEAARSAWRSAWPSLRFGEGSRFILGMAVGQTCKPLDGTVSHWLFVDAARIVHAGSAPGNPACLGVTMAAARVAAPIDAVPRGPGFSFKSPTGTAAIPRAARGDLGMALAATFRSDRHASCIVDKFEQRLYAEAMADLLALLEPEAMAAAARHRRRQDPGMPPSIGSYNLFVGADAGRTPTATAARWRRQAADAFPMFANDMRALPDVRRAIDGPSSLVDAIAAWRGLRPITVRALAGWPFGDGRRPTGLGLVLRLADATPPDWLPRRPEDWDRFRSFAKLLSDMGVMPFRPRDDPMQRLVGDAPVVDDTPAGDARRRILADIVRRNGRSWTAATDGQDRLVAAASHMADTGLSLCMEVVLPFLAARGIETVGMTFRQLTTPMRSMGSDLVTAGRSPHRALLVSAAHLERHLATTPGGSQDMSLWPPLGEDAVAPNGLRIANLSDSMALADEGARMEHCVGSYSSACVHGTCRILSVRSVDASGAPTSLSTAEISLDLEGRPYVAQHKARRNGRPSAADREAVQWYLHALGRGEVAGSLSVMVAPVAADLSRMPANGNALATLLDAGVGYDWRSREECDKTWRSWSRLLGIRQTTVEAWLSSTVPDLLMAVPGCPLRTTVMNFLDGGVARAA